MANETKISYVFLFIVAIDSLCKWSSRNESLDDKLGDRFMEKLTKSNHIAECHSIYSIQQQVAIEHDSIKHWLN